MEKINEVNDLQKNREWTCISYMFCKQWFSLIDSQLVRRKPTSFCTWIYWLLSVIVSSDTQVCLLCMFVLGTRIPSRADHPSCILCVYNPQPDSDYRTLNPVSKARGRTPHVRCHSAWVMVKEAPPLRLRIRSTPGANPTPARVLQRAPPKPAAL